MILQNPFHVLGLRADCTTRERTRRATEARAFLRIGKPLTFQEDLYFPQCQRNQATVETAITQLHDARQRAQFGLFWLTGGGPLNLHALRLLRRGKVPAALEALQRIEFKPVTAGTASSLNNLSTLCLLAALVPPPGESRPRSEWVARGLRDKARLLGLLPEPELVHFLAGLGDELAARDPVTLVETFGDSLKRYLEEARKYGVSVPSRSVIGALDAGGDRLQTVKAGLGSAARQAIEHAIRSCETSREKDPSSADAAALKLRVTLEGQLPALADATSEDDILYASLADAAAEELISASVTCFNHRVATAEASQLHITGEALRIVEYAGEIACGDTARQRARENLAALHGIEAKLRQTAAFAAVFAAVDEWMAACNSLLEGDTARWKVMAFCRASLDPKKEPGKSIVVPLADLNAPGSPLTEPTGDADSEAVALNSNVCHRLLALSIQVYNASGGNHGEARFLRQLQTVFVPATEASANGVSTFPIDCACAKRLEANVETMKQNTKRATQELWLRPLTGLAFLILFGLLLGVCESVLAAPLAAESAVAQPASKAESSLLRPGPEPQPAQDPRLGDLEVALSELSDQVRTLEGQQEQDAAGVRALRSDLERERTERQSLADHSEAALDALDDSTRAVRRDLSALRGEVADDGMRLEQEVSERVDGDRRGVWYTAAGAALSALAIGLLWWWSRRRTGRLRNRFDQSWTAVEGFLSESAEQSSRTLAALEEIASRSRSQEVPPTGDTEPDHKLVLLMCDEINRMENNLRHMDASVRGHRKLVGVVRRMKENLEVRGYEITELHGRTFDPGLSVTAEDWITDGSLKPGRKVISRVKTPEVRFQNTVIQFADVQVAVGK